MSETVAFNVNNYVRVKLTEAGLQQLRWNHDKLYVRHPNPPAFTPPQPDKDGYTRWQMWVLMQDLGPSMVMGMQVPFETTILVEVDQQSAPTPAEPPQSPA